MVAPCFRCATPIGRRIDPIFSEETSSLVQGARFDAPNRNGDKQNRGGGEAGRDAHAKNTAGDEDDGPHAPAVGECVSWSVILAAQTIAMGEGSKDCI